MGNRFDRQHQSGVYQHLVQDSDDDEELAEANDRKRMWGESFKF